MLELENTLELLKEQFPKVDFTFGFSKDFDKWFLFVSDYGVYRGSEFTEVVNLIQEELEILFISVFLAKKPKKNDEFIEIF